MKRVEATLVTAQGWARGPLLRNDQPSDIATESLKAVLRDVNKGNADVIVRYSAHNLGTQPQQSRDSRQLELQIQFLTYVPAHSIHLGHPAFAHGQGAKFRQRRGRPGQPAKNLIPIDQARVTPLLVQKGAAPVKWILIRVAGR